MNLILLIIIIFIIISGIGFIFWYAFRFEPVNFRITENVVNLKSGVEGKPIKSDIKNNNVSKNNKIKTDAYLSENFLKILHLSDFHIRADFKGQKLKSFLKVLSIDYYDFIFITGDMVEKNEFQDELIEMLKPLKAKYGIYAVFGAHDYYNKKPIEFIKNMFKKRESYSRKNDVSTLKSKLESIGIKVLQNESIAINNLDFTSNYNIEEIQIIGLGDPIINKMDLRKSLSDISDASNIKLIELNKAQNQNENEAKAQSLAQTQNQAENQNQTKSQIQLKAQGYVQNQTQNNINAGQEITENHYIATLKALKETQKYKQVYSDAFSPLDKKIHTLKNFKNGNNIFRIALIHTPDSYALVNLALNGVDIVFAGHTHGGQIRIPLKGAIVSGCSLPTKYASGLFYFKNFVLQISRGLGEGRFSRFRIYCDPEAIITEVRLL